MRQTLPFILLLLTLCACKKDKSSYWILNGVKYSTAACTFDKLTDTPFAGHYGITAQATASGQPGRIVVCYSNTSGTPADGTYSVITDDGVNTPGRAELMIRVTTGTPGSEVVYHSLGGSGTDGVQSTPDSKNNNRLTLRGAGITVAGGGDTTYLSLNLTQTN
ncbi:MAG: hypothetical protein JSS76_09250 [Bacteroidetes bacterium]|nr:hypothetical protein [Bacteroidota bacterium]MBS1684929.1 hypothetical protein [Bacteroidota bacterium]